jgi:hypothetical protein
MLLTEVAQLRAYVFGGGAYTAVEVPRALCHRVALRILSAHREGEQMGSRLRSSRGRRPQVSVSSAALATLAAIRIVNGAAAVVAPRLVAKRLGAGDDPSPATLYALRLFGIRTVVIGRDLLREQGPTRTNALRAALVVHASDTLAAVAAGREGLPARHARMLRLISSVNTALALLARPLAR